MPLVQRVFPKLFAKNIAGVDETAKMCRKLLENQWNFEKRQRKNSGWKLNPAKEKKRIYHK